MAINPHTNLPAAQCHELHDLFFSTDDTTTEKMDLFPDEQEDSLCTSGPSEEDTLRFILKQHKILILQQQSAYMNPHHQTKALWPIAWKCLQK